VGTAGNDTFSMSKGEGSYVIGSGGIDTAVYDGPYSDYQIKSVASGTLVITRNKISTLDELQGVSFIKFSDGTYNTTTKAFSRGPDVGNR